MSIEKTRAGGSGQPAGGPLPHGLRVSFADAAGRTLPVTKTPVTIGRKNAEILIPDATVSTLHATLDRGEADFVLTDRGSTNGTLVNGAKIAPHVATPIGNLDEVRFGEVTFTFNVGDDRFGGEALADTSQTLLIATAPTVAPIKDGTPYVLYAETEGVEQAVRLALHITTVGREGDVVITDQALSRKHFQIEVHADHVAVKDLGSANGTHVNERAVSYVKLEPGQVFIAGRTRFRLQFGE